MTGKAVLQALHDVWQTLSPLQLPMAVCGGLALAAWQHPRGTRDVDLLISLEAANIDQLLAALSQAGFRQKNDPAVLSVGKQQIVQLLYEPPETFVDLQVDLLIAESAFQQSALSRRQPFPFNGIEAAVLTPEDLILLKLSAGRIIDLADAVAVLRANRDAMDIEYLQHWAGQIDVTSTLDQVWSEAFPGEPLPG